VEGEGGKGGGREWGLGGLIGDEEEGGEVSLEGEREEWSGSSEGEGGGEDSG
jgi:hypothetical protein